MTQKEAKWSVDLEVVETQGYLCDILTNKSMTVPLIKLDRKV